MSGDGDSPGVFRVPLTNEAALRQMRQALVCVQDAAIDARRMLLAFGFADAHGLCRELDEVAARLALSLDVVHRDARALGVHI